MTPLTRKENYLNEIVGWGNTAPEKPTTPEEFFFAAILGEAVQAPEPLTRYQMYLAKIAGRDIEIPYPETRLEYFLAKAAGMDITVPVPITREEIYWSNYTAIVEFEIENTPPLTYKAIEGTLKNYRIYGNTVNGNSVGDRTGNLFDGNFLQGYWAYADGGFIYVNTWICTNKIPCTGGRTYTYSFSNVSRWTGFVWYDADGNYISTNNRQDDSDTQYRLYFAEAPSNAEFMTINIAGYPNYSATILPSDIADFMLVEGFTPLPYEPYGYKVPVTVEGKNLLPNADWVEGYITIAGGIAQPSPSNQEITSPFVKVIPGKTYVFSYYPNEGEPWRAVIYYTKDKRFIKRQSAASSASPVAFTVESGVGYVRFSYRSYGDGTFSQLELGDIVTDYEPYHAPVTTNIYIPEQLKMVGDKAEYVDYKEQKQHFADGTSTDVLLPTLPTLSGINTLSVATSVQPSNIEITGKIKGVTA